MVVSAISLLCAMFVRFEIQMLLIFLFGIQILSIICAIHYRRRPYCLGTSIAIIFAAVPVLALVIHDFLTAPSYHGQLYHEDGPQVFVALCLMALLVLSFFGTLVAAAGIFAVSLLHEEEKQSAGNEDGR